MYYLSAFQISLKKYCFKSSSSEPIGYFFSVAIATSGPSSRPKGSTMIQFTSPSRTTMLIGDGYVSLRDIGDTVRGCLNEFHEMVYNHITFGLKLDDPLFAYSRDLSKYKDDHQCSTPGYSFFSDQRNDFHRYCEVLTSRLFGDPSLAPRFSFEFQGTKRPIAGTCREFLEHANQVANKIVVMMHMCGGQPKRGTEVSCDNRVNCPGGNKRALIMQYGYLCLISFYKKTQHLVSMS